MWSSQKSHIFQDCIICKKKKKTLYQKGLLFWHDNLTENEIFINYNEDLFIINSL